MDIWTLSLSILSALIVAAGNHFFNRRYLLLLEREKYRQALFGEKLKAYREVAEAIYKFSIYIADLLPDLRGKIDGGKQLSERVGTAFDLARDVKMTLHRHIFLIPNETVDRITLLNQSEFPDQKLMILADVE